MALFIIFESGLQMLADNPSLTITEKLPCTEFITSVPVTWDETKVLYAKVGEAVVVAKRKENSVHRRYHRQSTTKHRDRPRIHSGRTIIHINLI